MARKIYTTKELAERFKCTPRTIIDWIHVGCPTDEKRVKIPARKLGKRWFCTEEDIAIFEVRSRPSHNGRPDLDLDDDE